VSIGIFSVIAYVFFNAICAFLLEPAKGCIDRFYFFTPQGAFLFRIKVAIFCGIIAAAPLLFYQIWMFVVPGLLTHEKKIVLPVSMGATVLFFLGMVFCYYVVLPASLKFLLGFGGAQLMPLIEAERYLHFAFMLLFAFGIMFLLPIIVFILSRLGIMSAKTMATKRSFVLLAICISAAVITPPDVFTQLILALPMYGLFEMSVLIMNIVEKKT